MIVFTTAKQLNNTAQARAAQPGTTFQRIKTPTGFHRFLCASPKLPSPDGGSATFYERIDLMGWAGDFPIFLPQEKEKGETDHETRSARLTRGGETAFAFNGGSSAHNQSSSPPERNGRKLNNSPQTPSAMAGSLPSRSSSRRGAFRPHQCRFRRDTCTYGLLLCVLTFPIVGGYRNLHITS